MAHFALVNDGIVRDIIFISNTAIGDLPFPESEPVGQAFIATLPELAAQPGDWKQTSYSSAFRGSFAGLGFTFDGADFLPPENALAP